MSEAHVERLRRSYEAFNRRDLDATFEIFRDDATLEPFLSRAETDLLRGRQQIREAFEAQIEAMDLRVEPQAFISVGEDTVIVPTELTTHGSASEMDLTASVTWLVVMDEEGLVVTARSFDSPEEALEAAERAD